MYKLNESDVCVISGAGEGGYVTPPINSPLPSPMPLPYEYWKYFS